MSDFRYDRWRHGGWYVLNVYDGDEEGFDPFESEPVE